MSEKRTPRTGKPTFETELEKLEGIVRALEAGDVPLAELVTQYEAGMTHLRACRGFLADAELRLEQLRAGATTPEPTELPRPGRE